MYPPQQDREGSFTISSKPPTEEPLDFRPSGSGPGSGGDEEPLDFRPHTSPETPSVAPAPSPIQQTTTPAPPEDKSLLQKGWELGHTPLLPQIAEGAKAVSKWATDPQLNEMPVGDNSWKDWLLEKNAQARGFGAGGLEGLGSYLSQMTAPFDLAATVGTMGSGMAAKQGFGTAAKGLSLIGKLGSAPAAAHGAINVLHPDSTWSERGQGLAEMGMGLMGTFHGGPGKPAEPASAIEPVPEGLTSPELTSPEVPPPTTPSIPEDYPTQIADPNKLSDALAADMVPNPPQPIRREIAQGIAGQGGPVGGINPELAGAIRENIPGAELPPPAVEWKPPPAKAAPSEAIDLGEIGDMNTSPEAMDVALNSADIINPRGEGYIRNVLKQAPKGQPGLASEGNRIVYRDSQGNPIGVATYKGDTVIDFAVDPHIGTRGKAAVSIADELINRGVRKVEGGMTPDAKNIMNRMMEKRGVSMEMPQATSPDIAEGGGGGKVPPNEPPVTTGGEPPTPTPPKRTVKNASPAKVKEMLEKGYELTGVNNGEFEFTYTGKKAKQPMLEEEVPQRVARKPKKEPTEPGVIRKTIDMMRANQSVDPPFVTSAAFRQAAPHMWTKKWFQAWGKAAAAYGDEAAYQAQQKMIQEHPLFRPRPPKPGSTKPEPSFAQEIGMRMTDAESYMVSRHEGLRAGWSEKIPVFGSHIKGSNRAFASFLNHIRVKLLEEFVANGEAQAAAHNDPSLNLKTNIPLAKEFAGVINDTTGSGELATKLGFKWKGKEISTGNKINLEKHINLAADVLYSPRLMARNIRMLNPSTYLLANPGVRKEYLKAMLRSIGSWAALATAAKMAGAEVSTDPKSTDLGKIKIGNTRLDPGAGFQQYLVFAAKEAAGSYTSSIEKHGKYKTFPLGGTGVNPQTRYSVAQTFLSNKFSPAAKFFFDVARASKHEPVYLTDKVAQLFVPMMAGDLAELIQEDPTLMPLVIPWTAVGGGSQTYSGEVETTKFLPSDWDIKYEGGGFF